MNEAATDSSAAFSSIPVVLVVVSGCLLAIALFTVAWITNQPTAISALTHLLPTSRRCRALSFGPPVHRPCYATEHSWAEHVLQALRDRRDAAADAGNDATTSNHFIYISDSPDFGYTPSPLH